jgi:hypothetical protein
LSSAAWALTSAFSASTAATSRLAISRAVRARAASSSVFRRSTLAAPAVSMRSTTSPVFTWLPSATKLRSTTGELFDGGTKMVCESSASTSPVSSTGRAAAAVAGAVAAGPAGRVAAGFPWLTAAAMASASSGAAQPAMT